MAKGVRWADSPDKHDFAAALDYLSLVLPQQDAEAYVKGLKSAARVLVTRKAKDILRASGLALLPASNKHVAGDLAKIKAGDKLSPVLLIRGHWNRPLLIADGFHRVCACEHLSEDTEIAAVLF